MSLLMKALEKAARDRGETQAEAAAPGVKTPLSLEPLNTQKPAPQADSEPQAAASSAANRIGSEREQARAAAVMQAGRRSGGAAAYVRNHPVVVFGVIAALFLLGFGIYVYLQIAHPGFFIRQAPPQPAAPLVQAPAPPAAPAVQAPIPTSAIVSSAADAATPAPAPVAAAPAVARQPPKPPVAAASAPAPAAAPRNTIVVSRGGAEPVLPPMLTEAYAALQDNRLDVAQRLYSQLLRSEPRNIDALLGLAAIAMQEGKSEDASRHYLRILELEPRHALAQSGLIALLGRADPLAAETRLKQLISREPSPFLYFTLGNVYADQSLWAQAQQAYFQAHHLEPSNPDYAYNLAVGLEHLGQSRPALAFYRRALQLAAARGRANFSLPQAEERIGSLASQVE
jgi:tetratricopeptide (TPR) repeat protein